MPTETSKLKSNYHVCVDGQVFPHVIENDGDIFDALLEVVEKGIRRTDIVSITKHVYDDIPF